MPPQSASGRRASAQAFEARVERNLYQLHAELAAGAWRPGRSICFVVKRPRPREVWAAQFRDRVVHWLLYNLPADCAALPEAVHALPAGALEGINDGKRTGYGGPCPPIGRHRYFHKLYALDCVLPDLRFPTKPVLEEAMRGHVLAEAQLIGTYIKGQ